ncbi:hypothetical protein [Terrabacter carboxydivorans]|uniref:Holin n=1 Tax=Terrabacter carboxydivorans TaxID=619730 RepID=A0ABP5ZNG7_9MICO
MSDQPNSPASPPDPSDPPSGWQTSEFWATVATNVVSLAVAAAALLGKTLDQSALTALIPSFAVLASAIATAFYAHSRSTLKVASAGEYTKRLADYNASLAAAPRRSVQPQHSSVGAAPEVDLTGTGAMMWALVPMPAGSIPSPGVNGVNRPVAVIRENQP